MPSPFSNKADTELVTLFNIVLKKFGPQCIAWETETLRQELSREFGDISEVAFQKVCAAQLAVAHDACWKEWELFEKFTAACNHAMPIFSFVQPPEAEEVCIAIASLNIINDSNEYSDEVLKYITAACLHDGLLYMDGPLSIAQPFMENYLIETALEVDNLRIEKAIPGATYKEPKDYPQVQANRVMSCRNVLKRFMVELEREKKLYAHLL